MGKDSGGTIEAPVELLARLVKALYNDDGWSNEDVRQAWIDVARIMDSASDEIERTPEAAEMYRVILRRN
jgi:hypothetical protein